VTTASRARVRRAHGSRTPGPKSPTRCGDRCAPRVYQAVKLGRDRILVPSCVRALRSFAARPVSNCVSMGIRSRRSRTPPALRSSATRDRSAGRARQGRCRPRLTDPLLPKPDRPGPSHAKILNGAGRRGSDIVRGCPLGTARDRCEWQASGTAAWGPGAPWRRWLTFTVGSGPSSVSFVWPATPSGPMILE
jgi:hypothetical protein